MPVEDNVTPSSWWVRTCLSVSAQTCKSARLRSLRICRASRWSPETREGIRADEVLGIPPPHTSKEWRSPTNENRSGFEGNYCSQVLPISENAPKHPSPPPFLSTLISTTSRHKPRLGARNFQHANNF